MGLSINIYAGASGTIEDNRVFGNAGGDIRLTDGATPFLVGNRED